MARTFDNNGKQELKSMFTNALNATRTKCNEASASFKKRVGITPSEAVKAAAVGYAIGAAVDWLINL